MKKATSGKGPLRGKEGEGRRERERSNNARIALQKSWVRHRVCNTETFEVQCYTARAWSLLHRTRDRGNTMTSRPIRPPDACWRPSTLLMELFSRTSNLGGSGATAQEQIGWPISKLVKKNHPVRNATYDTPCSRSLGQIIRSGRSDIEIWQIFDLYIEKKRYLETSCDRQIIIALFMRSGRWI